MQTPAGSQLADGQVSSIKVCYCGAAQKAHLLIWANSGPQILANWSRICNNFGEKSSPLSGSCDSSFLGRRPSGEEEKEVEKRQKGEPEAKTRVGMVDVSVWRCDDH